TVANTGVKYDGRDGGLLYYYRNPTAFETAAVKAHILKGNGCETQPLDRDAAARIDPALEPVKEQIAGALYAPGDESGDARLFTEQLARYCESQGATFKFSTTITGFDLEGDTVKAVLTDRGRETADIYVLSLGVYSPHVAKPLGVDLPIYPVKGYSVTVPVSGRNNPPRIGGVDEENLVAYCPLGDRLRITATAEFAGYSNAHKPENFRNMLKEAKSLFT